MTRNRGHVLLAVAALVAMLVAADDAQARFRRGGSCGSWGGSSYGSWGGGSWGSRGSWGGSYGCGGSWGGRGYHNNGCACNGGNGSDQINQGEVRESNYRGPQMTDRNHKTNVPTDDASIDRPSLRGSNPGDNGQEFDASAADPNRPTYSPDQDASRDGAGKSKSSGENGAGDSGKSLDQSGGPRIESPENKRD